MKGGGHSFSSVPNHFGALIVKTSILNCSNKESGSQCRVSLDGCNICLAKEYLRVLQKSHFGPVTVSAKSSRAAPCTECNSSVVQR